MAKTVKEILEWIEDEKEQAHRALTAEPNHNSNHLATAYGAEIDLLVRLKEFITEE